MFFIAFQVIFIFYFFHAQEHKILYFTESNRHKSLHFPTKKRVITAEILEAQIPLSRATN
jgi:hypothetical protein